jgi:hypothetical protein
MQIRIVEKPRFHPVFMLLPKGCVILGLAKARILYKNSAFS